MPLRLAYLTVTNTFSLVHAAVSVPRRWGRPRTVRSIRACSYASQRRTQAFDAVLQDAGLRIVLTGIRIPRMNSIIERWIRTCRREPLDRTLIRNQHHLLHALREYEAFYNEHRPHRTLGQAAPLRLLPEATTDPDQLTRLDIRRQDRLSDILHEYRNAA